MKSIKPLHGDRSSTRRRAAPKRTASSTESSPGGTPKRKRSSQAKAGTVSKKIACVSCGQTDVPLMLGGRKFPRAAPGKGANRQPATGFCRPCVEAGKSGNGTPQSAVVSQTSTPEPQSETSTTAAMNKRIAGLTVPPLVSPSPLATNPPLVPEESTDSTSVTPSEPPVAQP